MKKFFWLSLLLLLLSCSCIGYNSYVGYKQATIANGLRGVIAQETAYALGYPSFSLMTDQQKTAFALGYPNLMTDQHKNAFILGYPPPHDNAATPYTTGYPQHGQAATRVTISKKAATIETSGYPQDGQAATPFTSGYPQNGQVATPFTSGYPQNGKEGTPFTTGYTPNGKTATPFTSGYTPNGKTATPFTTGYTPNGKTATPFTTGYTPRGKTATPFTTGYTPRGTAGTSLTSGSTQNSKTTAGYQSTCPSIYPPSSQIPLKPKCLFGDNGNHNHLFTPPDTSNQDASVTDTKATSDQPIVLVYYDGETDCCSHFLAEMFLNDTQRHFKVVMVGPSESTSLQAGLAMPGVKILAEPGGIGEQVVAQQADIPAIIQFVKNGGRYLGICMGAYMASQGEYGVLGLFPAPAKVYFKEPGAQIAVEDGEISVNWRGKTRSVFYGGGPAYTIPSGTAGVTVLATYSNGEVATAVASYGKGKVAVTAPHVEAPDESLYYGDHYPAPTQDLANDLINTLMS